MHRNYGAGAIGYVLANFIGFDIEVIKLDINRNSPCSTKFYSIGSGREGEIRNDYFVPWANV